MYVYCIENTVNKKVYVGMTNRFKDRWTEHKYDLRVNKYYNPYLQEDYNVYGLAAFNYHLLEEVADINAANREDYWINYFGGIECDNVYNCQTSDKQNSNMIYKQNCKKLGSKRSDEFKQAHTLWSLNNNSWKGKHHTEETKIRLSESHKGAKNFMFGKLGHANPNYGRHASEETKTKIRSALIGRRKYSEQFIDDLKQDYKIICTYAGVGRKYNISASTVANLIKYGTPAEPNCYK